MDHILAINKKSNVYVKCLIDFLQSVNYSNNIPHVYFIMQIIRVRIPLRLLTVIDYSMRYILQGMSME